MELAAQDYDIMGRFEMASPRLFWRCINWPGSNAIDAANGVKKKRMAELKQRFPARSRITPSRLDTTLRRHGKASGKFPRPLLEALALVMLVVYLFLQGLAGPR